MTPLLPDPRALARCCDRLYRVGAGHRAGASVVAVPRGWARLRPGGDGDEFASTAFNRVHWLTLDSPLTRDDVAGADAVLRACGVRRAFLWLSAAGAADDGELRRAGAERVPFVRYVALARPAAAAVAPRPTALTVRTLTPDELPAILETVSGWYGKEGAPAAISMARAGVSEFHGAFAGEKPVALSALLMDRAEAFGYLGWTGTDPAHRGQGAQSALIAARVTRAAALGARWCVSETNTAVDASLRNLVRLGFTPAAEWHVYRWQA